MEFKIDIEKYQEYQKVFIKEITQTIMVKLIEAGMEKEQLEDTTASIVFNIASIIDDTTTIESDGVRARPYLGFMENETEVIHCGENSYTYEYVMGVMKQLFPH